MQLYSDVKIGKISMEHTKRRQNNDFLYNLAFNTHISFDSIEFNNKFTQFMYLFDFSRHLSSTYRHQIFNRFNFYQLIYGIKM